MRCATARGNITTPNAEGRFAFYNLREGDYEVTVDAATLPAGAVLTAPARMPIALRHGAAAGDVHFRFAVPKQDPPVRKIFEQ
jgi:hypothetical protein